MPEKESPSAADELKAKVLKPAELVGYQEGAVVSREIVRGNAGTVTIFAFDAGEGLSEHTAPFDALVHILEGSAEITVSGDPLTAKDGEAVIMPANRPHSLKALEPFKMVLTLIRS